ncbi:rhamnosyltransferase WsaF family glycosyltransferase [Cellulomonas timonensis]|uniref:rhamnosyltransferase WsaF family glycosyltransferase n=1 Tax=Cellulomonas timonensis TaxID=1689271 RepID=UPI00082B03CB|nr:glycosyl transferase group 1 [Cellulomonas timonensis]
MTISARHVARFARRHGVRELIRRGIRRLAARLDAQAPDLPLLAGDVADSTRVRLASPPVRPRRARPLHIGWLCTPPSLGSGGHTTMFRMIEALEAAGHTCTVFLYDRHGGDVREQAAVVRAGWPGVQARILSADGGIVGVDACVATSWPTAHVLASRGTMPMRRLYFVQDFEPYFFPRGSRYALAEDSYRLGLRMIALGEMVAGTLAREVGVDVDVVPFGCDTDTYALDPASPAAAAAADGARTGVVLYAKPGVGRRGYLLARLALEQFHARHPEQEIHAYGERFTDVTFPVTWHGRLTPVELAALYRRCSAGFALSFTNISLVAEEMLAAGLVPVVNDHPDARADLVSPHVVWAPPTPGGLAAGLERALACPEPRSVLAASARQGWGPAQRGVVRIIEEAVYGAADVRPSRPGHDAPAVRATPHPGAAASQEAAVSQEAVGPGPASSRPAATS